MSAGKFWAADGSWITTRQTSLVQRVVPRPWVDNEKAQLATVINLSRSTVKWLVPTEWWSRWPSIEDNDTIERSTTVHPAQWLTANDSVYLPSVFFISERNC